MILLRRLLSGSRDSDSLPLLKDIALEYQEEDEFACLLEEYKALRAEIVARLEAQQEILSYSVVLIGAALPVSSTILEREHYILFLLIPMVFALMSWLFLAQENMIDTLAFYLNTCLAPRMEFFLADKMKTSGALWEWELFQRKTFYSSPFKRLLKATLGMVGYILPILPGIVSIAAYWCLQKFQSTGIDLVLTIIDIVVMLYLAISTIILKIQKGNIMDERIQKWSHLKTR